MLNNYQEKIKVLQENYQKSLPDKMNIIEKMWLKASQSWHYDDLKNLHREVHKISGSAGSYGFTAIGEVAHEVELQLQSVLENHYSADEKRVIIDRLITRLKRTTDDSLKQNIVKPINALNTEKMVYIVDQDPGFLPELKEFLEPCGFNFHLLDNLDSLKKRVKINLPATIIVNITYFDTNEINLLREIQQVYAVPLFCISSEVNLLTRLKAIRAGSNAFFAKPIDTFYLARTLDQICGNPVEAYRILIIDDMQSLAEFYALTLQEAGMVTKSISDPLQLIKAIDEFQPDLLLMDIYMPECTGLELAAVLRQETVYTRIPIIFLSTENDKSKQLSALSLGGDDFISKPVLPRHLIEVVRSRAKRAIILNSYIMTDSLTGILNHTSILQHLDLEIDRALRQHSNLAFIMIDIDYFKKVNDTYGHPAGDLVLKKLASMLETQLRKFDSIGRYGGEEFAIILPHTDKEQALEICNRLRTNFSELVFHCNEESFSVTFSAGISFFPGTNNLKDLVQNADQALYKAKLNGRNKIEIL